MFAPGDLRFISAVIQGCSVRRVAVALVALPWAGLLVVGGLWLVLVAAPGAGAARGLSLIAGLTALAAGHVVFAVFVGRRLFPAAPPALGQGVPILGSIVVVAGATLLGWAAVRSTGGAHDTSPSVAVREAAAVGRIGEL